MEEEEVVVGLGWFRESQVHFNVEKGRFATGFKGSAAIVPHVRGGAGSLTVDNKPTFA